MGQNSQTRENRFGNPRVPFRRISQDSKAIMKELEWHADPRGENCDSCHNALIRLEEKYFCQKGQSLFNKVSRNELGH